MIFTAYGKEGVKMNFIDRIFIGELTSTVMCEECANVGTLEFNSHGMDCNHIIFIIFSFTYNCWQSFLKFVTGDYIILESLFIRYTPRK